MSKQDAVHEFLQQRGAATAVIEGGFAGLVEQWEALVATIEAGYELGLDDYLNDLDVRQLLDDASVVAPLIELNAFNERMQRADEQFNALTEPTENCLWGNEVAEEEHWSAKKNPWYYRRPLQGDADFLAEINEALGEE
jgi:hypothetical protein